MFRLVFAFAESRVKTRRFWNDERWNFNQCSPCRCRRFSRFVRWFLLPFYSFSLAGAHSRSSVSLLKSSGLASDPTFKLSFAEQDSPEVFLAPARRDRSLLQWQIRALEWLVLHWQHTQGDLYLRAVMLGQPLEEVIQCKGWMGKFERRESMNGGFVGCLPSHQVFNRNIQSLQWTFAVKWFLRDGKSPGIVLFSPILTNSQVFCLLLTSATFARSLGLLRQG